ncbi:MAG TPA: S8 family serine peptidase [Candidatus Nanoarchaeia archaeon]|nr:S8 family serine peptidase [Candidatus Nanoarchaeia archaeon]
MSYKRLVSMVVVVLLFSVFVVAHSDTSEHSSGKKRVIATNEREVYNALDSGCQVIRHIKEITVLACSVPVADSLGLQEDIRVFALDSGANIQIGADTVQLSGNTGVGGKVAILDSGYNYEHPELVSSYLGGKDFVHDDSDPMDDNGHGSHVAGLITADGIQSKARGVAPSAGILAVKVLGSDGSGYFSDVVAGIYYVVDGSDGIYGTADDFGVDAISLSLGTSAPYVYKGYCDGVLPSLTTAIKYARDRNVLVVVAAGNSGSAGISLPGCISYSTTVGAVDSNNKVASFSGRGNALDIVSPGVSLYSAWLGNSYVLASGTSMATPVVSGVVALIRSAHPDYSDEQVESALLKTAKDLGRKGKDKDYGYGVVDAYKAASA